MPRNSSNVYSPPSGTLVITDTVIESAKYNAFVNDLTTDLNTPRAVAVGGTGAATASAARAALGLDNWNGAIPELSAAGALDQLSTIGVHYVASANCTTVGGPTGGGDGIVYTAYASGGEKRTQAYHPVRQQAYGGAVLIDHPAPFRRFYTSAAWTDWLRDNDIGSDDVSHWTKSANGLLTIQRTATLVQTGSSTLAVTWTFPTDAQFVSTPGVFASWPAAANFTDCAVTDFSLVQAFGDGEEVTVQARKNGDAANWPGTAGVTGVILTAIGRWII